MQLNQEFETKYGKISVGFEAKHPLAAMQLVGAYMAHFATAKGLAEAVMEFVEAHQPPPAKTETATPPTTETKTEVETMPPTKTETAMEIKTDPKKSVSKNRFIQYMEGMEARTRNLLSHIGDVIKELETPPLAATTPNETKITAVP